MYPIDRDALRKAQRASLSLPWSPPHKPWLKGRCKCGQCKPKPKVKLMPESREIHVRIEISGAIEFKIPEGEDYGTLTELLSNERDAEAFFDALDPWASGIETKQRVTLTFLPAESGYRVQYYISDESCWGEVINESHGYRNRFDWTPKQS